ncbi:Acetyltransferase (GNAT) family protein [compost metagenome]
MVSRESKDPWPPASRSAGLTKKSKLGKMRKKARKIIFWDKERIYRIEEPIDSWFQPRGANVYYKGGLKMSRLRKLAFEITTMDLRNLVMQETVSASEDFAEAQQDYGVTKDDRHKISLLLNGQEVGYMNFLEIENIPFQVLVGGTNPDSIGNIEKVLYVEMVEVNEEYRSLGLGYKLYEEFGKIYNSQFNGWPVARYFVNPVAEYSFRKAVANGVINEVALTEQYITRDYDNTNRRELARDLRNKLPSQVQGPEIWSRLKRILFERIGSTEYVSNPYNGEKQEKELELDWDNIKIDIQSTPREENKNNASSVIDHEIYCEYYDQQVGYMHFSEFHDVIAKNVHPSLPDKKYENLIYVNNVLVDEQFRGWGIGKKLYEEFGKIYKEKFSGYDVAQVFVNPVAEYVFKEEIDQGNIPKEVFNEELIARDYDEQEKQQVKELFKWLPNDKQKDFKDKNKDIEFDKKEPAAPILSNNKQKRLVDKNGFRY